MPKTGFFVLHANVLPTVTAGHYELVSQQGGLPFTVKDEHTHVTVASPRYTMPTDQVLSTFPPANAEGAFGDRLPQIVLKRRTLPWERNPNEIPDPSTTPWLALVVVAEGEAQLSTAVPVDQCVTAGTQLREAATDRDVEQGLYLAVTQTVVDKIFPCRDELELLVHVREVDINDTELANGDDDGWLAVVLANRLPVYDTADAKAVRYMACLVNIEGQLDNLPQQEPPADFFSFELAQDWSVAAALPAGPDPVVMGGFEVKDVTLPGPVHFLRDNADVAAAAGAAAGSGPAQKAPRAGASLDGAAIMSAAPVGQQWVSAAQQVVSAAKDPNAKQLVRDTMGAGWRYPIEILAAEPVFRFPVLAHWSFTTSEGATFETLMQDLDVGLLGTLPTPAPGDPPQPGPHPEVVETGHINLGLRSRRGDSTRAWYRGPLSPLPTVRDKATAGRLPVAHAADQLRRVVPDGREDLALAAGFEIGRLLALSQLSVVSALLRFRNQQFGAGRIHQIIGRIAGIDIPALTDLQVDLGRYVAFTAIGEWAGNPQVTGPRRPVADPGREITVKGQLDEVIANGLGLDLAAVRKAGDSVGIVAALAQAQAPVAFPTGGVQLDAAAVTGLQQALAAEVNTVVGVALGAAAGKAKLAPGADALDELIERYADPEVED